MEGDPQGHTAAQEAPAASATTTESEDHLIAADLLALGASRSDAPAAGVPAPAAAMPMAMAMAPAATTVTSIESLMGQVPPGMQVAWRPVLVPAPNMQMMQQVIGPGGTVQQVFAPQQILAPGGAVQQMLAPVADGSVGAMAGVVTAAPAVAALDPATLAALQQQQQQQQAALAAAMPVMAQPMLVAQSQMTAGGLVQVPMLLLSGMLPQVVTWERSPSCLSQQEARNEGHRI